MTFLTCPNTFEIYNTDQIAAFPYEKKYAGEVNGVVGTSISLEKLRQERILWVFNQTEVYSAELSENGTIEKQLLMKMNVNSTTTNQTTLQALWVFDNFIVVRRDEIINSTTIPRPTTNSTTANPTANATKPANATNVTVNSTNTPSFNQFSFYEKPLL